MGLTGPRNSAQVNGNHYHTQPLCLHNQSLSLSEGGTLSHLYTRARAPALTNTRAGNICAILTSVECNDAPQPAQERLIVLACSRHTYFERCGALGVILLR